MLVCHDAARPTGLSATADPCTVCCSQYKFLGHCKACQPAVCSSSVWVEMLYIDADVCLCVNDARAAAAAAGEVA